MAQKANVAPDMATYWFNSMMYEFLIRNLDLAQRIIYPVEFDWPQKQLKKPQKANVEPDMATYWFNSMMYKFLITN